MTQPSKITERAKGLIREAIDDIRRSHSVDAPAAANLVAAVAMIQAPLVGNPDYDPMLAELTAWGEEAA